MSVAVETPRIDSVIKRIRGVRSRLFVAGAFEFLGKSLFYFVIAAVVSFVVDRELEPGLARRIPLMAFIAGVALVGVISELNRWFRGMALSDDAIASKIEASNPWLADSFISSLQLYRELQGGESFQSRALIVSTIQGLISKQQQNRFASIREAQLFRRFPILLGSGLLCAGAASAFYYENTRDYAEAWLQRVVMFDNERVYPKPVVIEIEIPEENSPSSAQQGNRFDVYVVRGEDLTVTANIIRGGTESMEAITRFSNSGRLERRRMARVSESSFSKTYQNVTEPFQFVIDAGYSVQSQKYSVHLIERARIEQTRFWLEYPDYTGLAATPQDKPITRTVLEVPVGTKVRYEIRSTRAVQAAKLWQFTDRKNAEPKPAKTMPKLVTEGPEAGRLLVGQLQVMKSMRFQFELVSEAGIPGDKNSVLYTVKAIEDRPPVVTFKKPGRSKSVTKTASLPMLLQVRDKYGVDRVEFHTKISRSGVVLKRDKQKLENPGGTAKKSVFEWNFQIVDLDLRENDQIEYWAVAYDRNIDPKKRAGRSLAYSITIVSKDDLSRLLADRLIRVKDDLAAAQQAQENARRSMESFKNSVANKNELDRDAKRRLSRIENQQRNVTTRMKKIASDLQTMQAERKVNRLTSDESEEQLQQALENESKALAEVGSPKVERQIRDILSQSKKLDRNKLNKVEEEQQRIEKGIQSLVDRLDKWGDISDVLRELQDIIEREEQVFEGTGANLRKKNQ